MNGKTLIEYCTEQASIGSKLSVQWEGGNDSGWFEFLVNDKTIELPTPIQHRIIDRVADVIGYGSFAGDFSTNGEVVYNPDSNCFEGWDEYSEDNHETCSCKLPVTIPSTIWFDKITIRLEADSSYDGSVSIDLKINNGPTSKVHEKWETDAARRLETIFKQRIRDIRHLSGVWDAIELELKDFRVRGKVRHCDITSFDYFVEVVKSNLISVSII